MPPELVPASQISCESRVKNSRFIASIGPANNVSVARHFIVEIKRQYSDATHNVPVYIIGFGSTTIEHANDDGEPPGTAGRPALAVLKGSGLGDVVLVITRYFGGTKLGTGGLVKAYSNAARMAVERVPRAAKILSHQVELTCDYSHYESIVRLIRNFQGSDIKEEFTDQVRIQFSLPVLAYEEFNSALLDLTNGSLSVTILQENQTTLRPYKAGSK